MVQAQDAAGEELRQRTVLSCRAPGPRGQRKGAAEVPRLRLWRRVPDFQSDCAHRAAPQPGAARPQGTHALRRSSARSADRPRSRQSAPCNVFAGPALLDLGTYEREDVGPGDMRSSRAFIPFAHAPNAFTESTLGQLGLAHDRRNPALLQPMPIGVCGHRNFVGARPLRYFPKEIQVHQLPLIPIGRPIQRLQRVDDAVLPLVRKRPRPPVRTHVARLKQQSPTRPYRPPDSAHGLWKRRVVNVMCGLHEIHAIESTVVRR